ncbi:MAG TPA: hypothetical protein VGB74_09960 [Actinoplanes sp.]
MAFIAAAAFLAAGTAAAPALAAPALNEAAKPAGGCIPVDGHCISLNSIDENTEIYIGEGKGGSLVGFDDFADFANWADNTYDVTFSLSGGAISADFAAVGDDNGDNGDDDEPDNADDNGDDGDDGDDGDEKPTCLRCHHNGGGNQDDEPQDTDGDDDDDSGDDSDGGWSRMAQFATFYDKGSLSGLGFVVSPGEQKDNLKKLKKPGGGTWDNKISSVRVVGNNSGLPGVVLCSKASCKKGGWVRLFNNGDEVQLTGGLSNQASFVGVFAG